MNKKAISLTVNGRVREALVAPRMLLSDFIRLELELPGTHVGCDTSQCGACVIHVDGRSVKSCTMLAKGASISTLRTSSPFAEVT